MNRPSRYGEVPQVEGLKFSVPRGAEVVAVLSVVAERALHELTLARMTLNGEMGAEKLPPVPEAKDETDRRRLVALGLINRLSDLLSDVAKIAEDTDRTLYEMAGGWELAHQLPLETEEKRVFGFAAARKAA